MEQIKVLDCTLRDGGYINQWEFGGENIPKIITGLEDAGIDIIECGFIKNRQEYNEEKSIFQNFEQVEPYINTRENTQYVCMINYGENDVEAIPQCREPGMCGIRVAFHKKDCEGAMELCRELKKKGYLIFVQPMVSLNYSDEEFQELIFSANEIKPYAFYIVDSFGVMKTKNLLHFYDMAEKYLDDEIYIGYHSHNNLQMAFSNAQEMVRHKGKHGIIIDACIMGMGRGAGNLNTELFVEYLNDELHAAYRTEPILHLMDEVIGAIYNRSYWGYSLPHYLSAIYNCHPNYASYLAEKNTLTVTEINEILSGIPEERRIEYSRDYAEGLYLEYLEGAENATKNWDRLEKALHGKTILIIGPGKSAREQKKLVEDFMNQEDVVSISVNGTYQDGKEDYIFVSNLRRYKEFKDIPFYKMIVTSNIRAKEPFAQVDYKSLRNNEECVSDNAAMMLIRLLISVGAKKVALAGIDGYSYNEAQNYADKDKILFMKWETVDAMNTGMKKMLKILGQEIEIDFLTQHKML